MFFNARAAAPTLPEDFGETSTKAKLSSAPIQYSSCVPRAKQIDRNIPNQGGLYAPHRNFTERSPHCPLPFIKQRQLGPPSAWNAVNPREFQLS